jgi:hypothetical protein
MRTEIPAQPKTPPGNGNKRRLIAHDIGVEAARALQWNPADYTEAELVALGEHLIRDYARHGDEAAGTRMLTAVAKAAGALDPAAVADGNHDRIADQLAEFLQAEFKSELAVSQAVNRLARLRAPSRHALAQELLRKIGLDPDRRAYRPDLYPAPPNFTGKRIQDRPVDYYINADSLAADDLPRISQRALSGEEIAAMQKQLPASLNQELDRRFDAYTRDAADLSTGLVDSWLSWIARKQQIDLGAARVELSLCSLQYYRKEVLWIPRGTPIIHDGQTRLEFPAIGYLATLHTNDGAQRYFLSTRDGSARPLPPGISPEEWTRRNRPAVFGVARDDAARPALAVNAAGNRGRTNLEMAPDLVEPPTDPTLLSRVVLRPLAQGRRDQLAQWLAPALRDHFDRTREAARGRTSAEELGDFLLDFIPYRSTVVAIRQGDFNLAKALFFMDTVLFLLPSLSPPSAWKQGAAGAMRKVAKVSRLVDEESATRALPGILHALARPPELRASIKAALDSLNTTSAMTDGLRPLDARDMAESLGDAYPRVAHALEQSIEREQGPAIDDGWWRVPMTHPSTGGDAAIETLRDIEATDAYGDTLVLRPYGNDSRRAYTRIDRATRQRTGAILTADDEGRLYRSLPASTLERYRVRDRALLNALGANARAADGTVTHAGKTYARIVDDYVEITPDHGSTVERPAWRVIPPRAAKRDIVIHRLSYDKERALWRQADIPGLKGGGRDAPGTRLADGTPPGVAARGDVPGPHAFHDVLVSRIAGNPTAREVERVRDLLARLEAHPRARAILRAMEANHTLRNEAPEIILRTRADPAQPRPSLEQPVRGNTWHLDLNALNAESLDWAAGEVAAVYNNMTGILDNADPFAHLLARGEPALDPQLEASWRSWIAIESARAPNASPVSAARDIPRERHEALIERLRQQLRQARCYGGLDKNTFIEVLENRFDGEVAGLRVDLSEQHFLMNDVLTIVGADHQIITSVPPLPGAIHALDVSGRLIRDWRNLPANLKLLKAAGSGSEVVKHLPAGLLELDISNNGLEELPANLPATLEVLNANGNRLRALARLPDTLRELAINDNTWLEDLPLDHLPSTLTILHAAGNRLRDLSDLSRFTRMHWLDLSRNSRLTALPRLPPGLATLRAADCDLAELPEDLPRNLEELYVNDNRLTRLPNLPRRLNVLALGNNRLARLPASIRELAFCSIDVRGNPIHPDQIPHTPAGTPGPRITYTPLPAPPAPPALETAQARPHPRIWVSPLRTVQYWVSDRAAIDRWETILRDLGDAAVDANGRNTFLTLLDRLRTSSAYSDARFRADIEEWLIELSKPEREPLRRSTLQMCAGANEFCGDRVSQTLNGLRQLRVHDDIRMGRYNDRPAEALNELRQSFRLRALQDIAYRKATAMKLENEDVEFYLKYAVELREKLGLTTSVPAMDFPGVAGVTREDLDLALREVQEAERTRFYKDLVIEDSWHTLVKTKFADRYEEAMARLRDLAEEPLTERINAQLVKDGLNPADADARRNVALRVWRDMQYEVLEPLTRDYLAAVGIALPR